MKKASARLILPAEERLKRDLILVNNPVLAEGLALAPVVAAAVTLRNAAMLAIMVFLLLVPTRFLGNLLVGLVPQRLRAMTYALTASLLYAPALYALAALFGVRVANLGIYLPMIAVDSIIISRTEIPQREAVGASVVNGIKTAVGFMLAVALTGALRELLGEGRILGAAILAEAPFPIASTVAGGFMVVSLLAAALQSFSHMNKRRVFREAREHE